MRISCSLLLIVLLLIGCGPHKMYEEQKQVPTDWPSDQGIKFSFIVDDTTHAYNIIAEVGHEESFGYQNLYTRIVTDFPDGNKTESIVSLDVRKKSGASQGNCSGTVCTVPFLIQKSIYFKQLGEYGITLFQHSRKDTIQGILNANLIVQRAEENK